ncbi:MAG: glycosyltransferase family 61 protein [Oculatellaceae cyanobacterium Prado106]|nr:glycosyltransferase family 61 protein [Oculatellaceae cyanobacterium Prado106]
MTAKTYRQFSRWLYTFRLVRSWNDAIAHHLRNLPFNSEILGAPKGVYLSTRDWFQGLAKPTDASYREVGQHLPLPRPLPKSLESSLHWKFRRVYEQNQKSPPLFVAQVPQGRVWNDSAVIAPDDRLLGDVSFEFGKNPDELTIFRKWKLRPAYSIQGTVALLTVPGGLNYYHWMCDLLPRLELIRRSGVEWKAIDRFIVNSTRLPFQQQTLAHLGIPLEKVIESEQVPHIKADRLLVPSLFKEPNAFACDFLRSTFLTQEMRSKTGAERIYVTRAGARYRHLLNEAEVIHHLTQRGFQVLQLESMTVAEQVTAFAHAKWIVAPHGASLTNLAFCQPGTKLVELFSPNYVNICFWMMSHAVNIDYAYVIGEGKRPPEFVYRPVPTPYRDNMTIPVNALLKILDNLE